MAQDERKAGTNAADSAPGVNDGSTRAGGAQTPYHPKGTPRALMLLAAVLILLAIVFIAKPEGTSRGDRSPAVAPDSAAPATAPEIAPTAQAGGPAGQTPTYPQAGGVGGTEVYSAKGKVPAASEDAPGRDTAR